MSQEETLTGDVAPAQPEPTLKLSTSTNTHLSGRWRTLAHGWWLVVAVASIATLVFSIPVFYGLLQTPCTGDECVLVYQVSPHGAQALQAVGISLTFYAGWLTACQIVA